MLFGKNIEVSILTKVISFYNRFVLMNDEILMNEKIMQKLEHFFSCFYNILLTIGLNIGCFVLFYNKKII